MKRMTLDEALKTEGVVFKVTPKQMKEINKKLNMKFPVLGTDLSLDEQFIYVGNANEVQRYSWDYVDTSWENVDETKYIKVEIVENVTNPVEVFQEDVKFNISDFIPDGYEIDKENSKLDNIILKKQSAIKKWEDLSEISGYYITTNSYIVNNSEKVTHDNRNVFATKEQAEANLYVSMYS